jgi:hypothetical protein
MIMQKQTVFKAICLLLGFLSAGSLLEGQPIGVGIKVGVPLTEALETTRELSRGEFAENRKYLIGPQVELRLPFGLGIEADALLTNVRYGNGVFGRVFESNSWEFPILAKYRAGGRVVRPFVSGGMSFRRLQDIPSITTFRPTRAADPNSTGFVAGGGLEVRVLHLKISPEFRFTRWGAGSPADLLQVNRNQGQFLVGFGF